MYFGAVWSYQSLNIFKTSFLVFWKVSRKWSDDVVAEIHSNWFYERCFFFIILIFTRVRISYFLFSSSHNSPGNRYILPFNRSYSFNFLISYIEWVRGLKPKFFTFPPPLVHLHRLPKNKNLSYVSYYFIDCRLYIFTNSSRMIKLLL